MSPWGSETDFKASGHQDNVLVSHEIQGYLATFTKYMPAPPIFKVQSLRICFSCEIIWRWVSYVSLKLMLVIKLQLYFPPPSVRHKQCHSFFIHLASKTSRYILFCSFCVSRAALQGFSDWSVQILGRMFCLPPSPACWYGGLLLICRRKETRHQKNHLL